MAQTFTNEEFEGINFNCYSKEANVGWYHICEAVQDGNVLVTNKLVPIYLKFDVLTIKIQNQVKVEDKINIINDFIFEIFLRTLYFFK